MDEKAGNAPEVTGQPAGTPEGTGNGAEELWSYRKNPYVRGIVEDRIIYSNRFYYDLYQLLQSGMAAVQAYEALGFDTKVLGTNRASCAAKRAKEKARNNNLKIDDDADEAPEEGAGKDKDKDKDVPLEIARLVEENPYIKSYSNGKFKYYEEIYPEVRRLLDEGKTAAQAFEALGIPVSVVGADRAASVAKRAKSPEYAARALFNPGGHDGTLSLAKILTLNLPLILLVGHLISRIIYLEAVIEEIKKKEVVIFGHRTVLKSRKVNVDSNRMVDWAISQYGELFALGQAGALTIFGVARSTYAAYKERSSRLSDSEKRKLELRKEIAKGIRQILRGHNGNVPGKRKMKALLERLLKKDVPLYLVASVMNEMGVSGTVKRKDAYKGQARYNHPCSAKANLVCQDFYKGVGKVILTDITYLYYGRGRKLFYLCVFRDAFTMETLGWAVSARMDQKLVSLAYERMKKALEKRGVRAENADVYIHSDQGSVYLSTSFTELLRDDEFVQSVSRRGNSLDNSACESFFGTFKAHVMNQLALAKDYETAAKMVGEAIRYFNEEEIMETLGWLTPHEYYVYATTGLYPADTFFGFKKEELLPAEELIERRKAAAARNAERQRNYYNRKKSASGVTPEERAAAQSKLDDILKSDPVEIIRRDLKIAEKNLDSAEKKLKAATDKRDVAKKLKDDIEAAKAWADKADDSVIDQLRNRQNWRKFSQLSYINDMDGMFA